MRIIYSILIGCVSTMAAFQLPQLDYGYSALEPIITKDMLELHHKKHHNGYVQGLNDTVQQPSFTQYQAWNVSNLLLWVNTMPHAIQDDIRFFAGGHANHTLFWRVMIDQKKAKQQPEGSLHTAIEETFGSFETFKKQFTQAAAQVRGSGWAWLVVTPHNGLAIRTTHNHDNPLSQGEMPILVLDVWEHAYYLKYTNERGDYISKWWKLVHWDFVERLYTAFVINKTARSQWFETITNLPYTKTENTRTKTQNKAQEQQ